MEVTYLWSPLDYGELSPQVPAVARALDAREPRLPPGMNDGIQSLVGFMEAVWWR